MDAERRRDMKLASTDLDRIRQTAASLVEERHLPGLAVGVVQGDDLVFAEGFGFADIESGRRQDPALRQRIGSITKTMTALCIMALIDEGRLSLDDRIVGLLPDVPLHGHADALTVRHLLTHTGGIGEAPTMEHVTRIEEVLWSDAPEVPSTVEAYPNGILIEVPPGTKWAYANHGYGLLGEILARKEGMPVDDVLRRRIFEPLGMESSDSFDRPHPDLTTGYHRAPDEEQRVLIERSGGHVPDEEAVDGHNIRMANYQYIRGESLRAAGAVQSTIYDMGRYASALLRRGGGIVRPETFDAMVAPQWCLHDRLPSQGFAFARLRRFGRRVFGHGGGVAGGWNTMLSVLPDDDVALLVHLNLTSMDMMHVGSALIRALVDAPPAAHEAVCRLDPAVLAAAPGLYQGSPGTLTNLRIIAGVGRVRIEDHDGDLYVHSQRGPWKDGVRMLPADASDPTFFMLQTEDVEPAYLALVRNDAGEITGLRGDMMELIRAPDSDA
jgi:CubicO group peptidase (beta-lactamase class C family)